MIKYDEQKALIIEDFAEFAGAVSNMLKTMGIFNTNIVTSGEAAIQACKDVKYDIILSDYNLGSRKDGQQVLEELTVFNLIKPDCTFIMITAEKTTAMVMAALEFQPDSYLTKPFNHQLLKSRLDKIIIQKQILSPIYKALAKKDWLQAYNLCEKISSSHKKYNSACLHLKFESLHGAKRWNDSLQLLEEMLEKRSTPWILKNLGTIYFEMGKLKKSESIFCQMIKEFPMALEGYDWLAKIQHQQKKTIEAQQTLQKAVERSPKLLKRQKYLGQLAEINHDYETMTQAYRQAVKFGQHSAFSEADEYVKLTQSIGKKLKDGDDNNRSKLIDEVESLFQQIDKKFKHSSSTQFRSAVAHADFSDIINDTVAKEKYLKNANVLFDSLDDQINTNDSIEIITSLKSLGLNQLAESVLKDAVEQHFENSEFLNLASKLTTDKDLILNANKANQLNNKAVKLFKDNNFSAAITYFEQAAKITPNNINICLNHSQALLKQFQTGEQKTENLYYCQKLLNNITRLPISDPRYARFSELSRLNRLMIRQIK